MIHGKVLSLKNLYTNMSTKKDRQSRYKMLIRKIQDLMSQDSAYQHYFSLFLICI